MSSVSMQQWLVGAAFHLHMRIHQVRTQATLKGQLKLTCMFCFFFCYSINIYALCKISSQKGEMDTVIIV